MKIYINEKYLFDYLYMILYYSKEITLKYINKEIKREDLQRFIKEDIETIEKIREFIRIEIKTDNIEGDIIGFIWGKLKKIDIYSQQDYEYSKDILKDTLKDLEKYLEIVRIKTLQLRGLAKEGKNG